MEKKISVDLGTKKIVAEVCDWNDGGPNEIAVYLCDEDGAIIQDICLARGYLKLDKESGDFKVNEDLIECMVWGNSQDEDYTHKFVIDVWKEGE